jgi:two-component system, NarL family, sensor histidine kinase DegS
MTTGVSNPKEALINEVRSEYDRIQLRLRELQTLIDQSQAEVKRLQQKSIDVTTQMNRLEANFDTVPRNDIKVIYTNAIDSRTRLLTMQSQLEKVQQDRTQLESFAKTLERLLSMLEGVPVTAVTGLPQIAASAPTGENGAALSDTTIIRIIEAQESERQRLARQMHDGPAQSLTNFILQAEICQRLFDRNPDRASEELGNLKTAASTTFQKVRDFIFDLRPMMLDDLGLAPTVRRYVDAYAEKSNIETRLNIVGEERRRMESHTEVMMFRSVQELLGYGRDISGANKVEVVLDISGNPIKASVTFNGKNIEETEAAANQSQGKIVGLNSLRQRLELVGGLMDQYGGADGEMNRVDIVLPAGEPR